MSAASTFLRLWKANQNQATTESLALKAYKEHLQRMRLQTQLMMLTPQDLQRVRAAVEKELLKNLDHAIERAMKGLDADFTIQINL